MISFSITIPSSSPFSLFQLTTMEGTIRTKPGWLASSAEWIPASKIVIRLLLDHFKHGSYGRAVEDEVGMTDSPTPCFLNDVGTRSTFRTIARSHIAIRLPDRTISGDLTVHKHNVVPTTYTATSRAEEIDIFPSNTDLSAQKDRHNLHDMINRAFEHLTLLAWLS